MMVTLSRSRKQYGLGYFLIRGALVIMIAAGLEAVAWGIFPFIDMDVLFLIGISLPLAYLFLTLDREARWGIILALFCATPVLQLVFGTRHFRCNSPLRMLHPVKRVFSCQRLPGIGSSAAGSRSFPGLVSHFWEPSSALSAGPEIRSHLLRQDNLPPWRWECWEQGLHSGHFFPARR